MKFNRTCLVFVDGLGVAQDGGVTAALAYPPVLGDIDIEEIYYVPGVHASITPRGQEKRPMTEDEKLKAVELLIRMANDARDALDGQSTLVVIQSKRPTQIEEGTTA